MYDLDKAKNELEKMKQLLKDFKFEYVDEGDEEGNYKLGRKKLLKLRDVYKGYLGNTDVATQENIISDLQDLLKRYMTIKHYIKFLQVSEDYDTNYEKQDIVELLEDHLKSNPNRYVRVRGCEYKQITSELIDLDLERLVDNATWWINDLAKCAV